MNDQLRWPPNPGERVIEARPRVAPFLALPIQPFVYEPRELVFEGVAHLTIIRDAVVIEMPL